MDSPLSSISSSLPTSDRGGDSGLCRSILFEKKNKNEKRERERSSLFVDHKADEEIEQESNLEEERSHAEKEHTKQELINMKSDLETSRQRTAQSLHDKINKEKERAQMLNERLEKEKLKKLSETFEREKEKKEELKKQLHAAKYETLVSKELRKTELQDMEAKLLGLRLKQFKISKLFMDLKNAEKVDICFLIDSTGSMSGVINEVKTVINRIVADSPNASRTWRCDARSWAIETSTMAATECACSSLARIQMSSGRS